MVGAVRGAMVGWREGFDTFEGQIADVWAVSPLIRYIPYPRLKMLGKVR